MLQETHDKLRPHLAKRDHGFRWRGHDISRIEGLSDAVFAFAITLLVVSLEVPKTFSELREMMRGFLSFGMCFALLLLIWHAQYLYFRRYALDDRRTFLLNAALLFVVAFYIYPLKFLFSALVDSATGYQAMKDGVPIPRMNRDEWSQLMLIYGAAIWLDSASLTAGTAGTAEPSRRGATLAVHSTLGYFGGFIGPLAVGWVLDFGGGNTAAAWSAAFGMIAAIMLLSLVAFVAMRPHGLAGDKRT